MTEAYDIKHCIHCGKQFCCPEQVLLHIKHNHMVIGSG
jgi:hypothetical protein